MKKMFNNKSVVSGKFTRQIPTLMLIIFISIPMAGFHPEKESFMPMQDVQGFKNGIKEMAANTQSIKATFKQDKYLSILTDAVQSSGTMRFKKPDLLKWSYTAPYEYAILLDGEKIRINDEGNINSFNVRSSKIFQELNALIINSVQGNILQEERFEISYFENDRLYMTRLIPRQEQFKKYVNRIDVYFEKNNYTVEKLQLFESETDYTVITFQNKKINAQIPDEEFFF